MTGRVTVNEVRLKILLLNTMTLEKGETLGPSKGCGQKMLELRSFRMCSPSTGTGNVPMRSQRRMKAFVRIPAPRRLALVSGHR